MVVVRWSVSAAEFAAAVEASSALASPVALVGSELGAADGRLPVARNIDSNRTAGIPRDHSYPGGK